MQPVVQVERHGVSPLDARHELPMLRCERDDGTDRSVHMEPDLFPFRDFGQRGEIVDGSRVDRAAVADHACGNENTHWHAVPTCRAGHS